MQNPHFVEELRVQGLWGDKNLLIRFNPDITIIVGPNASGKTTILNILRYVLSPEIISLSGLDFQAITLRLRSFAGLHAQSIKITKAEDRIEFKVGQFTAVLPLDLEFRARRPAAFLRRGEARDLVATLQGLVPAVWLPVSRRLPISGDKEAELYLAKPTASNRQESQPGVD